MAEGAAAACPSAAATATRSWMLTLPSPLTSASFLPACPSAVANVFPFCPIHNSILLIHLHFTCAESVKIDSLDDSSSVSTLNLRAGS